MTSFRIASHFASETVNLANSPYFHKEKISHELFKINSYIWMHFIIYKYIQILYTQKKNQNVPNKLSHHQSMLLLDI